MGDVWIDDNREQVQEWSKGWLEKHRLTKTGFEWQETQKAMEQSEPKESTETDDWKLT